MSRILLSIWRDGERRVVECADLHVAYEEEMAYNRDGWKAEVTVVPDPPDPPDAAEIAESEGRLF
jgi:hypothetical protein